MPTHARAATTRAVTAVMVVLGAVGTAEPLRGGSAASPRPARMVRLEAGTYRPLYRQPSGGRSTGVATGQARERRVETFEMDVYPVTNGEYLEFVRRRPEWRRSGAKRLFTDAAYLQHWQGDIELGPLAPSDSPVVNVSWFAARAYLKAHGKELPTVDQWEYAAAASDTLTDASRDPSFLDRLRGWYGRPVPARLPAVGTTFRNRHGIADLHGVVWEWTLDFNSALVTGESRGDSALERTLYCGSGAAGAADFENYPAFMRYALRSSLEARYSVGSLGFRGVRTDSRSPS